MSNNMIKIIKHKLFKISITFVVVLLLGWGISSVADDNIKSATNNFSAMGLVSEISDDSLKISDAKGSDKSGNTVYDLNIENLEKIQTNKNELLNFTDIKEGDKIIVQGLTNGSTFFIKRIISFTSVSTFVATSTATTTDDVLATSTATTTDVVVATTTATTTDELVASSTTEILDTATTSSTSTDTIGTTTTATTATTTDTTATTVIESIVDTVKEVIENIVEAVTGDTATSTPIIPTENAPIENPSTENQIQDIPLQNLIENTEIISEEIAE